MSLPERHSPPGLQLSSSRMSSFLVPLISSPPHTPSIQPDEILCHHNAITISRKQVQKQNQDAVLFMPTKGSAPPGQLPAAFPDKACKVSGSKLPSSRGSNCDASIPRCTSFSTSILRRKAFCSLSGQRFALVRPFERFGHRAIVIVDEG